MSIFKRIRGEHGFTLVELLVTVTIIGVLAAVVTVGVSGSAGNAQTQANKQLFASIQTGIDAYSATYPTATGVPTSGSPTAGATGWFRSDGSTYTVSGTELFVNLASGTNSFYTFFRIPTYGWNVGAAGPGAQCLVANTTTFTLNACHN